MFSVNQAAMKIVHEKILPNIEQLNCAVVRLGNGATVIDMGLHAPGGWQAGKLFTEVALGGLAYVRFGRFSAGEINLPSIDVYIDHPQIACISSQFSSWKMPPGYLGDDGIPPLGGGPARAIARNDIFSQAWGYQDMHHETVLGVQISEMPDEAFAQHVADACKVRVENVYLLVAKTGSLAGMIQICSRSVETSIWRLRKKGLDLKKIIAGMGSCPIPPPTWDEHIAMDRVNTAVIYGGSARYLVDANDEEVEAIIGKLSISSSDCYGEHFMQIYEDSGRDIFKIEKDINTISVFDITNLATGRTFREGVIREDMLTASFF
jgi:methenyltetrahydromethanopterin cyclohydrolase